MLTLFKNSELTIGVTASILPWMQVFCNIKTKDNKPEQMVNTIMVGRLNMTNSIVLGYEAEKASYFVFFFFRIVALWAKTENENTKENKNYVLSEKPILDNIKHNVGRAAYKVAIAADMEPDPEHTHAIMYYLYNALKPYESYFLETYMPFDSLRADDAITFIRYYEDKYINNPSACAEDKLASDVGKR